MARQLRSASVDDAVQVTPESVEVQMLPPLTTAASFVPSDDEAMVHQLREPAAVRAVQFTPESVEVQMLPP